MQVFLNYRFLEISRMKKPKKNCYTVYIEKFDVQM